MSRGFAARVLIVAGVGLVALVAWKLIGLLLAIFGAAVLGVLLNAITERLRHWVPVPHVAAMAIVIVGLSALLGGGLWLFGAQISDQLASLRSMLPAAYADVESWLQNNETGRGLSELMSSLSPDTTAVRAQITQLLSITTSTVGQIGLMLVGAIYLAANPGLYRRGLLHLIPPAYHPLAGETLTRCGTALRAWLLGQLTSMAAVGILTALGLWLLDVPAVLGIALLTAALGIVPIVGPIMAAVPAALLGFTVSPQTTLWVVLLYVLVQQIEGNILQPIIQKHAVELPPAVLLFSLFAVGALFGPVGVLLAAPMTVVVFVAIKRLYVGQVLGNAAFGGSPSNAQPPVEQA